MKTIKHTAIISTILSTVLAVSCSDQSKDDKVTSPVPDILTSTGTADSTCAADASWVNNPSLPTTIPDNGATLCDFYQFSWQSFLYLMSPNDDNPSIRNFENLTEYPIFNFGTTCTDPAAAPQLFLRVVKGDNDDVEFHIPQGTGQAGGGATIYDQAGNVVYYSVSVNQAMCEKATSSSPNSGSLPDDTLEMKFAWRVIDASEATDFVTMDAVIGDDTGATTLGLIGMHLVQATPSHPEMVWSSFEHTNNAPNCLDAVTGPADGWDFTSATCTDCLQNPTDACLTSCNFNVAKNNQTPLTGPPTEICRLFPEGTDINNANNNGQKNSDGTTNNNGQENIDDVNSLNTQIVGPGGLVSNLGPDNPLSVIQNYMHIGAIWVTDINIGASDASGNPIYSNQRGSLQLENPVAETVFQGALSLNASGELAAASAPADQNALNCFTCHTYTGPDDTISTNLSHAYSSIIPSSSTDSNQ